MIKLSEDEIFVYYKFDTDVYEKIDDQYIFQSKQGYCKFNKITGEFDLNTDKTDLYFHGKREVEAVRIKLIKLKSEGSGFPERTGIVTS